MSTGPPQESIGFNEAAPDQGRKSVLEAVVDAAGSRLQ